MKVKGLNKKNIKLISDFKKENQEVLKFRLKSYDKFKELDLPSFGPTLNINFDNIIYYESDVDEIQNSWKNIDKNITCEFKNLGVISSEKYLDGMGVQYQSEVIYHSMLEELDKKGVIFTSIEEGFKKHYDILEKYFSKI